MKQVLRPYSYQGFTLIELILYVALVSIFIIGAIIFSLQVTYGRVKATQQQLVEQSARALMARVSYEIRRAKDINTLSASSVELENGATDTTIFLSGGTVQITTGGVGPLNLTSNQVHVADLTFSQPGSTNEDTKNVNVTTTVQQAATGTSAQFEAQTTMSASIELNTQFNDARKLLIDASAYQLSGNLLKTELQNLSSTNITIDKMTVSWTGGPAEATFQEIKINGSVVWSGSAASGTEVDITNVVLVAGADPVLIDKIQFSDSLGGAVLTIKFTMTDGASASVIVDDS